MIKCCVGCIRMITIRQLRYTDMAQAISLKMLCWPEELAGLSDVQPDSEREFAFWTAWMSAAQQNNDVRILYGAFDGDEMLGVAFGSFVESKDAPESGLELNGLWVYPKHRGKGVSLRLLLALLDDFYRLGAKQIVIYNFHFSSSNSFYRKFGCQVIGTEYQTEDRIPVDIFSCDIADIKKRIAESLGRIEQEF